MSTLEDLVEQHCELQAEDIQWLQLLLEDWESLADLSFSDVVLWVPTKDAAFVAVAHARPATAATMFYRDVVGDFVREDWAELAARAMTTQSMVQLTEAAWYDEMPMEMKALPVVRRDPESGAPTQPFAVVTLHANLTDSRTASRLEKAFKVSAHDLFTMIEQGRFPDLNAIPGPRRGAPRAVDGLIRLNEQGVITFASPNTLSMFTRVGFRDELEGELLSDVVLSVLAGSQDTDEKLPIITAGKSGRRADVEARGRVITLRSIPVFDAEGARTSALVLSRDITEMKQQEQELITKDATIREIHHRVKNNLQTVASLLRIQARRAKSQEARDSLSQAMRRVAAIAVVHDTLSTGLSQIVDFDSVFDRVLLLVAEVASIQNTTAHTQKVGTFGQLPSEYATPLALALTELVTNAVEHGLAGMEGDVVIAAERSDTELFVAISDTGAGLPEGIVGDGLGTQIVRTLIQGELGGSIEWASGESGGTRVSVRIPLRWMSGLE